MLSHKVISYISLLKTHAPNLSLTACSRIHPPSFKMSFKSAYLLSSVWPWLSLLDMIYLIQLNWQVLMWYKDKCSRLMELKPTLLFPCCASLTHVRLMSLIKENKCFRHPPCKSIKFVCAHVCSCVCGKLSQLFSLSIISASLHSGFSLALNGREYKLQLTLNRAFTLLTEAQTCDYIKQRGKTIDYLINFQLLLVKRTGSRLRM